jgi:hypothetical protein
LTDHTPFRAAAITEAARQAGAIDETDILNLVPATEMMNPADAVATLKATKPHLFRAKMARDMSKAEHDAALQKLGVNPKTIRRHS